MCKIPSLKEYNDFVYEKYKDNNIVHDEQVQLILSKVSEKLENPNSFFAKDKTIYGIELCKIKISDFSIELVRNDVNKILNPKSWNVQVTKDIKEDITWFTFYLIDVGYWDDRVRYINWKQLYI